jgi:hypothetical protein
MFVYSHIFACVSFVMSAIQNPVSLCHPSLVCSILFHQRVKPHCCKIPVYMYFKPFTLRNQLLFSHS